MAQNRIIYDIDGKVKETSGSYYDDATGQLIFNNLTFNTMSIPLSDGILFANNKNLSSSLPNNKQFILWDTATSRWSFKDAPNNIASQTFIAGSDLSGAVSGALVRSLSNARTGTLSALYGGTGLSTSSYSNGESLLVYNGGSSYTLLNVNNAQENSVISSTAFSWLAETSSIGTYTSDVDVAVYTTPGTYTWSKPPRTKAIRVIVQGGGGAGGAGANRNTLLTATGGGGGGSGGLIDTFITIDDNYNNIPIIVGSGGLGGNISGVNSNGGNGSNGSSSSFGNIAYAAGGLGGLGGLYNGSTSTGVTSIVTGTLSHSDYLINNTNNTVFNGDAGGSGRSTIPGDSQSNTISNYYLNTTPGGGGGGGLQSGSNVGYDGGYGASEIANNGTLISKNATGAIIYSVTSALGIISADFITGSNVFVGSGGGGGAAFFNQNPSLLMKFETLTSSVEPFPTLSLTSPAVTSSVRSKFGTKSLAPTGPGGRTALVSNPGFGSDFTVESWIYPITTGSSMTANYIRMVIADSRPSGSAGDSNKFIIGVGVSGSLFYYKGIDALTYPTYFTNNKIVTGSWNHVAVVRRSNTISFYINGVKDSAAPTDSTVKTSGLISLGASAVSNDVGEQPYYFNGYIDEFATYGYAKYTSSFAVPTQEITSSTIYSIGGLGGAGAYGSGGGGGGASLNYTGSTVTQGGNGGDGYVAVISYKF